MPQEAVAIGRTFAAMKDYHLDGNKEMVALGTMNIIGSMTSCYVATGRSKDLKLHLDGWIWDSPKYLEK